jgi:hypothetical protein
MKITITEQTAKVALRNLWLHNREIWHLDAETRQGIIAIDELVRELEAEELLEVWEIEEQAEMQRVQAAYEARKAAEKAGK